MERYLNPLIAISEASAVVSDVTSSAAKDIRYNIDSFVENDENYMTAAFNFLTSFNEEYNVINKIFYRSILESNGDPVVVQEAFGNFFTKFKEMISKFLNFIKSLFVRFVTKLNSMVKSQKYLLKHKNDFKRFTSKDNFDISGYKYTFDTNVPIINCQAAYDAKFVFDSTKSNTNFGLSDLDLSDTDKNAFKEGNTTTNNTVKTKIKENSKQLDSKIEEEFYDKFRGEVLGLDTNIDDADFSEECFAIYRNGETTPESIEVNSLYITAALKRIEDYKKWVKNVEDTRDKIEREYRKVEKQVENFIKSNKTSTEVSTLRTVEYDNFGTGSTTVTMTSDAFSALDAYLKTVTNQVQEMSNIHTIAFSAKLQAMKDQFTQDKSALYKALEKCQTGAKLRAAKEAAGEYYDESREERGKLWII